MFVMVLNWSVISFDLMQFHNKFSYHALSTWDSIPLAGVWGAGSGERSPRKLMGFSYPNKPKKTCLWE